MVAYSNKGKTKEISGICVLGLWSEFPSIQKSDDFTEYEAETYICAQAYHIYLLVTKLDIYCNKTYKPSQNQWPCLAFFLRSTSCSSPYTVKHIVILPKD